MLYHNANKVADYPSANATKINCKLIADLREVDRSQFTKCTGVDGLTYYDIHYNLVITMLPAMMKFSCEVRGKEVGSVSASYD